MTRFTLALALIVAGAAPSFAATWTVQNTNDSGDGSLRWAIGQAASGDVITFAEGVEGTITLASQLQICDGLTLTITGPGPSRLAISGNHQVRVFLICRGADVTLSGVKIERGRATAGGGIELFGNARLTLTNSTVSDNSISGNSGGGIANFASFLIIANSTVSGNVAEGSGASGAGGIFHNQGRTSITNSTLAGNSTNGGGGGAIYNNSSIGALVITNSTLYGNTTGAFPGAAIYQWGVAAVTLKNTLLSNQGTGTPNCYRVFGTFTSQGYNLSDDDSCTDLMDPTDQHNTPAGLDPNGLQDNHGPTRTIALVGGSAALDAIPPDSCTDTNGQAVTTDQRGVSRPQGLNCDIGAFEFEQTFTYAFTGFLQPVENPPVVNVLSAGQGVPVKFKLGGWFGLDIFAPGYPKSMQVNCSTSLALSDLSLTVAAGASSLSYDPATNTYTYVWKTEKAWARTCRQLIVRLNDGTDHVALFRFR